MLVLETLMPMLESPTPVLESIKAMSRGPLPGSIEAKPETLVLVLESLMLEFLSIKTEALEFRHLDPLRPSLGPHAYAPVY